MVEPVTVAEIEDFIKTFGVKRSNLVLSSLNKTHQFVRAMETPVGKEILSDILNTLNEKLELIITEKATEQDKAEFRVLYRLATQYSDKINNYIKNTERIKKKKL